MAGKQTEAPNSKRSVWQRVLAGFAILVFALLLCSCNGENAKKQQEVGKVPVEQEKARLLKEVERRYENPEAHYELGKLYHADGMWSKAETHYNITLGFDPGHKGAQASLVKVMFDRGGKGNAEFTADLYMTQASSSGLASLKLGLAFQGEGLDDYALACYRQALRLNPNSAKINRQIGYYYLSKGEKDRAQDYLTRSFQLNPNQPDVAGQLGRLGVAVKIPRKGGDSTKKLDKTVDEYDKKLSQ